MACSVEHSPNWPGVLRETGTVARLLPMAGNCAKRTAAALNSVQTDDLACRCGLNCSLDCLRRNPYATPCSRARVFDGGNGQGNREAVGTARGITDAQDGDRENIP